MLFLEDTNGDGKADSHKSVLSGFGFNDSHTMSHLLVRGPGGWVHFSHGALNAGNVVAIKTSTRVGSMHVNYLSRMKSGRPLRRSLSNGSRIIRITRSFSISPPPIFTTLLPRLRNLKERVRSGFMETSSMNWTGWWEKSLRPLRNMDSRRTP